MERKQFIRRCRGLSVLLGVWLLAILAVNFILAGPDREKHLEIGRKIALHTGEYHAPRGRLLDRDGTPLAWSEKYFDLIRTVAMPDPNLDKQLNELLKKPLRPEPRPDGQLVLRRDLSPEEIARLETILQQHLALRIEPRLERISVNSEKLRRRLGAVAVANGRQTGISGLELQYDEQLGGRPGRYEVMLDRYRNWVESTWCLTTEAVPGQDVRLDFTINEML